MNFFFTKVPNVINVGISYSLPPRNIEFNKIK